MSPAQEAPAWLADPGLTRLWAAVRARLERNGLRATGSLALTELTREERHAVGGLLGRPLVRERVSLDLAALDAELTRRSGLGGLVPVAAALTGAPLTSRPALRTARAAEREAPFTAAADWLRGRPLAETGWLAGWLGELRRSGTLTTVVDGPGQLIRALRVLAELTGGPAPQTRTTLAATVLHDAHALDPGTLLAQLVLRGLAAAAGEPVPRATGSRRELWERFAVSADAVSTTCLTLGLRAPGDDGVAGRLNSAAACGDPIHLTGWDLRRLPELTAGPSVLVCENPAVLEAAAVRFGGSAAVVCAAGQPALVVLEVLRRLSRAGCELRYHGDFDWPGIAIANRLVDQAGVRPWEMTSARYRDAARAGGLPLTGRRVVPGWDPQLGEAMLAAGVAVHEEAVLDPLLDALAHSVPR